MRGFSGRVILRIKELVLKWRILRIIKNTRNLLFEGQGAILGSEEHLSKSHEPGNRQGC